MGDVAVKSFFLKLRYAKVKERQKKELNDDEREIKNYEKCNAELMSKDNDAFSKPKSGSVESNDRGTTNNNPFSKPKSSFVQSKDNSSRSSIAMSKPKPTTSEVQECSLALGDKGNIVAKTTVFERKGADDQLHSVPLGEAYQRVSIHTILDGKNGKTLLPVPLNDADIMTIGSSIVDVGDNDESVEIALKDFGDMIDDIKCDPEHKEQFFPMDEGVFQRDIHFYIALDEIKDVCIFDKLNYPVLVGYMRLDIAYEN
ncbi:hypothetical protein FRX31_016264 [Thalictrum thalictroides]|uniref:DUF8039 domain-containing protein n=1 Tax=Thalictrum thalictroides TaxID=46969 RepID=A0A7J6W9R5_THATH|nr:hypothetical protein FRX31_016264 [Thalictrum thalictroides]